MDKSRQGMDGTDGTAVHSTAHAAQRMQYSASMHSKGQSYAARRSAPTVEHSHQTHALHSTQQLSGIDVSTILNQTLHCARSGLAIITRPESLTEEGNFLVWNARLCRLPMTLIINFNKAVNLTVTLTTLFILMMSINDSMLKLGPAQPGTLSNRNFAFWRTIILRKCTAQLCKCD